MEPNHFKIMKYIIKQRYQYWGNNGIQWTDWYVGVVNPMNEKDAKDKIKELVNFSKDIDKRTKLKHEFMLYDYKQYQQDVAKQIEKTAKALESEKEYRKSQEYKDLLKRKRAEAKERKEHQAEYIKMMSEIKNTQ